MAVAVAKNKRHRDAITTEDVSAELDLENDDHLHTAGKTNSKQMEARVRRRYKFLKDEYTVAETVNQMLDQDRYNEALYLTRLASKDFKVAVSWNAVIRHLFSHGRVNDAVKLYQEMKKRGQVPNARTYTTIFGGCAHTVERLPEQALNVATKMYYSLMSDPRMRPNTIHMNAVLQVCARAKDMQALFNIAKTANTTTRMPDSTTYTTILSAMRAATELPYDNDKGGKYKQNKYKKRNDVDDIGDPNLEKPAVTVRRARATWEEVVLNWRRGYVNLDEKLVCSMGRILLLGGVGDNSSVLALLNQTMGIPRLDKDPRLAKEEAPAAPAPKSAKLIPGPIAVTASTAHSTAAPTADAKPTPQAEVKTLDNTAQIEPSVLTPLLEDLEAATSAVDELIAKTIDVIKMPSAVPAPVDTIETLTSYVPGTNLTSVPKLEPRPKKTQQFAAIEEYDEFSKSFALQKTDTSLLRPKPSNNTLSLVLSAIAGSRRTTLALPYWNVMISKFGVKPDSENCHQLLRAIKRGRSSAEALEALLIMPKDLYVGKTFKLAMEVCTFNTLNHNTFKNAGKILDLMSQSISMPDAGALRLYLKVALTSNQHFKEAKTPEEAAENKAEFGKQIIRALQRLWDPVRVLGNGLRAMEKAAGSETGSVIKKPYGKSYGKSPDRHEPDFKSMQAEYVDLLKLMVSATDMIVSEKMADADTIKDMTISRNLLNRQVTRFYTSRSPASPPQHYRKRPLGASRSNEPAQNNERSSSRD